MSRASLTTAATVLLFSPVLLFAQKKGKNDQQNADPVAFHAASTLAFGAALADFGSIAVSVVPSAVL